MENFIANTPVLSARMLSKEALQFLNGEKKSENGKRSLQLAAANFIWHNLGSVENGNDVAVQKQRKKAFDSFGSKMMETFPDCFFWANKPQRHGKNGRKQPYHGLLKKVGQICTARRRQGHKGDESGQFWKAGHNGDVAEKIREFDLDAAIDNLWDDLANMPSTSKVGSKGDEPSLGVRKMDTPLDILANLALGIPVGVNSECSTSQNWVVENGDWVLSDDE